MGGNKVRKRVAQACERCRQRKFKCDGQKPECSTCMQSNEVCLYEPHIRRRGLQEGYVRGLELVAGLAIRYIDNFEESILSRLSQGGKENCFEWQSNFEDLMQGWRQSKLSSQLESLLPSLPSPKSLSLKRKFEDDQSPADVPRRVSSEIATSQQTNPMNDPLVPGNDSSLQVQSRIGEFDGGPSENAQLEIQPLCDNGTMPPRELSVVRPRDIDLPLEFRSLVRIYFSQTHCWLPIVDKTELMRSSYRFAHKNPDTPSPNCGSLALVWAVTASTTSQLLKSGHLAECLESENVSDELVSSYYTKARELIPSEGPFEIEHVQAIILLTLVKIDQSLWSAAWILVGQAVRIAIDLTSTSTSARIMSLQKQTFLGCFVLDTLISFHLLRPPHLREEEVVKYGAVQEDGLDEWDIWSNPLSRAISPRTQLSPLFTLSSFNRLVNICKALQSILISRLNGKPISRARVLESLNTEYTGHPFNSIFKSPSSSYQADEKCLPHHHHLRLIYLIAVAELSPRSNSIVGNEHPWTQPMGLVCASEIRKVISEIGDKFGLNAIPQTCPLISAIAARSQVSIENDIGGNFSRPLIPGSCPVEMRPMNEPASLLLPRVREERIESERDIQHRFPQRALNDGELLQQDPLADSNSVFNDFVAIDTFEWTSNWEEGLFNLGFTADSSTYDFMTSASPVLSHTLAVSLIHGQQR